MILFALFPANSFPAFEISTLTASLLFKASQVISPIYGVQKEKKEVVYTGDNCPICGKPLVVRQYAKGKTFIACSGYPKCNYTVKEEKPTEENEQVVIKKCPDCGGDLIKKRGKYGYFLGCTNYPKCNHMEKIIKRRR